tara:strand:+ start:347 stop:505 length:159 start_codon:yes stop_codon:yes gene_type:complete
MNPKKPVKSKTTIIVATGLFVADDEKKLVKSFINLKNNLDLKLAVFINVKYV